MGILKKAKTAALLFGTVVLHGCATVPVPASPVAVADQTVLDEKAAIAVELAYQAAALSATTARRAGLIGDARWATVQAIDRRAYGAVQSVRAAYRAGNAASYATAFIEARAVLASLMESAR